MVIGSDIKYRDVADLLNAATQGPSGFAHSLVDVAIDIAGDMPESGDRWQILIHPIRL